MKHLRTSTSPFLSATGPMTQMETVACICMAMASATGWRYWPANASCLKLNQFVSCSSHEMYSLMELLRCIWHCLRLFPSLNFLCMSLLGFLLQLFAKFVGLQHPKLPAHLTSQGYRDWFLYNPAFSVLLTGIVVLLIRDQQTPMELSLDA